MTRDELAALMARARPPAPPAAGGKIDPLDALGALADALDRLQKENRVLRQRLGIPLDADLWSEQQAGRPPPIPVAADPLQDLGRVLDGLGRIHGVGPAPLGRPVNGVPPGTFPAPRTRSNGHRRKDK